MRAWGAWEVVLNDGSSMFPQGKGTSEDAVAYVELVLEQLRDKRYIVGVKPTELEALYRN